MELQHDFNYIFNDMAVKNKFVNPKRMNKIYDITQLKVNKKYISFELKGNKIHVPLTQTGSDILPVAKHEFVKIYEIDEDGIGIYWPALDEDLSIEGLLRSAGREDLVVKHIPSIYLNEAREEQSKSTQNIKTV